MAPAEALDAADLAGQEGDVRGHPLLGRVLTEGDMNMSARALGQKLQELDRAQLEEFAQELFACLKLNEPAVVNARHNATKRATGGARRGRQPVISASGFAGSSGAEPPPTSARRAGGMGGASTGSYGSATGLGGMRRGGSGQIVGGGAAASSTSLGHPPVRTVEAEAAHPQHGLPPRSPRAQAVTEAERQQIFNRLYNSAREQRFRRRTHAELGKLHDEVRMAVECTFDPRMHYAPTAGSTGVSRRGY